jgi:flagellar motor switch protein FliN
VTPLASNPGILLIGRVRRDSSISPFSPDKSPMASDLAGVLQLEVPVIVRLGERSMNLAEVLSLVPGSIIELPKPVGAELDLLVNNKQVGTGVAVKVGENFGLRITYVGDVRERIEAMGEDPGV